MLGITMMRMSKNLSAIGCPCLPCRANLAGLAVVAVPQQAITREVSETGQLSHLAASQLPSLPLQVTTGVPAPYSGVKALVKA